MCTYAQTFWTAAVKDLSLRTVDGSWKYFGRFLPSYHHTSLQSVVERRDVQGIVDVRGHSKSAQSIATVQIARTYRFMQVIWLAL